VGTSILAGDAIYPTDHKAGMKVPKGGSSCAVCEYLKGPHECGNPHFIKWNDGPNFVPPSDEFCCDWFEAAKEVKAATPIDDEEKDPLGWYGFDFDKTIAHYDKFRGMTHVGEPVEGQALARLKTYIKQGKKCKIFSARARDPKGVKAIEKWCEKYVGKRLEVTNEKDEHCLELYDDLANVEPNTGKILAVGTHEGALKGWDTRGRSKHESDKEVQRFKTGEKPEKMWLNFVPFESGVIVKGDKKNPDEFPIKDLVNKDLKEPPLPKIEGKHPAAGIIMQEKDGRVWTVTPMNYYGGYVNTFPKGTIEKGETPQEAAIREVHEETGLVAKITGYVGDFERTTSITRYYLGERVGGTPQDADEETFKVNLLPADEHIADRLRDAEGYKTPDHKILNQFREGPDPDNILHEKYKDAEGTNKGGFYKGADGVNRYVKFYNDPQRSIGEAFANDLYRDLGLSAPKSVLFNNEGKTAIASELLKGKELNAVQLTPELAREILKGFAADVLTVNWDAVGLEHDNVLVDGNKVHRIDNGGTFLMRAQEKNGYKPEGILHGVGELQSLFNPSLNPAYSKIAKAAGVKSYEDIPDFKEQVKNITSLEKKSGGWANYVKENAPKASPVYQAELTKILEARSQGLWEAVHKVKINSSAIWQGIHLVGFSGPEEEAIRASLSRIPPELLQLSEVECVQSAKELNAKHGRYLPEENKILFNPDNLSLRTTFGGGENPIRHEILTLVHEFGHALFGHLTPEEKTKWLSISGWREGRGLDQAPPYVERRPGWEPYTSEWTHRAGVKFPRYYAEKNPNEHFSDAFAYFMLNKAYKLADNQREYFEKYILDHVKRYPQALIQSPVKAVADDIVAAAVLALSEALRGGTNERTRQGNQLQGKEISAKRGNGQTDTNGRSIGASKHERNGRYVKAEGTREGALKGWDTRGRGRHPKDHPKSALYKQKFEEQELGIKITPPPELEKTKQQLKQAMQDLQDIVDKGLVKDSGEKKKYKPGEKQKEKVEKFLSGEMPEAKGGKISILGGIWTGNAAPVVIYKTMMTGEWHSKADLAEKMPKDILEKWAKAHAEALAKGDTKFWGVNERIESGIKRVTKAGQQFGQWTMESKWEDGVQKFRLVMNKVQDQAKGQEGITADVTHKALQAIQKMVSNTGLDSTISKQAMYDYLSSVGIKDVSALSSCVSAWTGSAQSDGATRLKMVAAEYYGNNWSKEYANHGMKKEDFDFNKLSKQAMAIKALSNEYIKAAGTTTFYRGMHSLPESLVDSMRQAVIAGKPVAIPINSLTGYSVKLSTASSFGSDVVFRKTGVKPEDVWVASGALPHLFGSFKDSEKEYLLGAKTDGKGYVMFDPKDVWIRPKSGKEKSPVPDWAVEHYKKKYGDKFDPSKL